MANQMPPVPPANRSSKGPGSQDAESQSAENSASGKARPQDKHAPMNQAEQDRHGNIKQNTTNQGYQQDR